MPPRKSVGQPGTDRAAVPAPVEKTRKRRLFEGILDLLLRVFLNR